VLSDHWGAYPILRFSEVPPVEIALLDRPQEPSLGPASPRMGRWRRHGECAGARHGVRLREMPFTWDRLQRAALA
jgi:CO/xanthine dehydrogenase Mo-binding subunit